LGCDKGQIGVGAVADITIANVTDEFEIDVNKMASKAKNTPFGGRKVKGKVLYTIVGGKVVVENGELA
jgi:dihydroorotase